SAYPLTASNASHGPRTKVRFCASLDDCVLISVDSAVALDLDRLSPTREGKDEKPRSACTERRCGGTPRQSGHRGRSNDPREVVLGDRQTGRSEQDEGRRERRREE